MDLKFCFIIFSEPCIILIDHRQKDCFQAFEELFQQSSFHEILDTASVAANVNEVEKKLIKNSKGSEYRLKALDGRNGSDDTVELDFDKYLKDNGLKQGMLIF